MTDSTPPARPFPIPVVAFGPGSQSLPGEDGEAPYYLDMPKDMQVFSEPQWPQDTDAEAMRLSVDWLSRFCDAAEQTGWAQSYCASLLELPQALRQTITQALGFGEVSAFTTTQEGASSEAEAGNDETKATSASNETMTVASHWRVQETAFAGLWRVLRYSEAGAVLEDRLECTAVPAVLSAAMQRSSRTQLPLPTFGAEVMNAPALVHELLAVAQRQSETDAPAQTGNAHVINLSLLPLSEADLELLYRWLGHHAVHVLSRGYGNCRITSTRLRNVWWVQYFNSMDQLILNSIEVTEMPEVVLAAAEDWQASCERLRQYLEAHRAPQP